MDQRSFQRLLRRTVALPVTLLVVLAVILTAESLVLSRSFHRVDHSAQVLIGVRQLSRYISEVDTAGRGYYLTGDPSLLQAYEEARARIPEQLDAIAALVSDNPEQEQRLQELRAADLRWLQWAEQCCCRGSLDPHRRCAPHRPRSDGTGARQAAGSFVTAEAALQTRTLEAGERLNNAADAVGARIVAVDRGPAFHPHPARVAGALL